MEYKGFVGIIEYDGRNKLFTGEVDEIKDVVTFHGRTYSELEQSFRESVDMYLDMLESE